METNTPTFWVTAIDTWPGPALDPVPATSACMLAMTHVKRLPPDPVYVPLEPIESCIVVVVTLVTVANVPVSPAMPLVWGIVTYTVSPAATP